jgi:hypothetical protein
VSPTPPESRGRRSYGSSLPYSDEKSCNHLADPHPTNLLIRVMKPKMEKQKVAIQEPSSIPLIQESGSAALTVPSIHIMENRYISPPDNPASSM